MTRRTLGISPYLSGAYRIRGKSIGRVNNHNHGSLFRQLNQAAIPLGVQNRVTYTE